MQYEEALKRWGAARLAGQGYTVDTDTVRVSMEFSEGYPCCGGSNPGCYCSFAESPKAYVEIYGMTADPYTRKAIAVAIDYDEFNFARVLGEIVETANGVLTSD